MTATWVVLRCAGASTLPLARSLGEAGFEVWTPTETVTKRVPRTNVKRRITLPVMPGYLFADRAQLWDLVDLAEQLIKGHRDFSVMRKPDLGYAVIADETLEPLRLVERKHTPVERALMAGESVKLLGGGFDGLHGVIETARGQFAMVRVNGFRGAIKVASWCLLREEPEQVKRIAA